MNPFLQNYSNELILTGKICDDVPEFLILNEALKTNVHCAEVARMAGRLARRFGADPLKAVDAGYLHDISAVIPNMERLQAARVLDMEILPEEEQLPMILHQKLSVVMAREIFSVIDPEVLSAVGCHSTLKRDASTLDKVVFLADKIAWDQPDRAPFLDAVKSGLERSLDQGVFAYLDYLWQQRASLPIFHPWVAEAYNQLAVFLHL